MTKVKKSKKVKASEHSRTALSDAFEGKSPAEIERIFMEMAREGKSGQSIADDYGCTRQAVDFFLRKRGLSYPEMLAEARAEKIEKVPAFWNKHPEMTRAEVARSLDVPLTQITHFEVPESRRKYNRDQLIERIGSNVKDRDERRAKMIEDLRKVAARREDTSKPMSNYEYDELRDEDNYSVASISAVMGWSNALREAGLETSSGNQGAPRAYSDDELISSVAEYIRETGKETHVGYIIWAQDHEGRPSPATIRNRTGLLWSEIVRKARRKRLPKK